MYKIQKYSNVPCYHMDKSSPHPCPALKELAEQAKLIGLRPEISLKTCIFDKELTEADKQKIPMFFHVVKYSFSDTPLETNN